MGSTKTFHALYNDDDILLSVEACSLCVVPKASLMYISAKVDNRLANASS